MTTENNELSYFQKRMNKLGITEADNKISIWQNKDGKNELQPVPVFRESDKGIEILVYSLDRLIINYKPDTSRYSRNYCLTRLEKEIVKKDGSVQKYMIPKGQGTFPFFHPKLIDKFEKKEKIDTLFITEGFFKAWKGCMHGMDVIGVSSITHLKEKETGKLHLDIRKLRDVCGVKRLVWLTDGDCLDVSQKDLKEVDLFKRPKNFYSSCESFRTLLDDWDGEAWFFHPLTDDIISTYREQKVTRGQCKGLDDLLETFHGQIDSIVADSKSVSGNGTWFQKMNITRGTTRIWQYFHLGNVNDFYLYHVQNRPEMQSSEFVFNGTRYKYDDKDKICKIMIPSEAKLYFRVGDNYYKMIEKINQFGEKEASFEKRLKATLQDDHGKNFIKFVPKFEAFCNVPGHVNHQAVHHNNYNVYFPFEHEPEEEQCTEEDCPTIIFFLKHIFGEQMIKVKQREGDPITTANYQLGLDYIQLLYRDPTQRLPILCLVSRENETGKSTFGDLMKAIFTNNATVVGNSDLADDFNSFWATKLLIMCDEAKIDKQMVIEKVKSLNFAKKIGLNAKGKDKVEIDFFGKFMFFTNNEENFIYASDEDLRYWVIKVPRIKEKNPDFLTNMISEIPAFLSLLNHRKIVAPRFSRMWFDPEILKTDALRKVIANSHSTVKKELTHNLREMFLDFGSDEIFMTCKAIKENFFRNKEENYIERVLKEEMKVKPVQHFIYKGTKYSEEELAFAAAKDDGLNEMQAIAVIQAVGKVVRHSYPRWETLRPSEMGKPAERVAVWVNDCGRAYRFFRQDFVTEGEQVEVPQELLQFKDSNGGSSPTTVISNQSVRENSTLSGPPELFKSDSVDDLPF